jgi:hypothetical protein
MKRTLLSLAAGAFFALALMSCEPNAMFYSGNGCVGGDGGPLLCIVSPVPDAGLMEFSGSGTNLQFDVEVAVGNFSLHRPGDCPVVSNSCGHIHLFLDNGMCSQPGGGGYIVTQDTLIHVNIGTCPTPFSTHTLRLELHNDLHGPLSPPVIATETFTALPM